MIPNILHFIWIRGDRDFGKGEFLSVCSALCNTTYDVVLHTDQADNGTPYNPWQIQHPRFRIRPTVFPRDICGVKARMANLSDIWRIRILHEMGGYYSDLDFIWFHDFDISESCQFVSAYENPTYRTVANAWMGAVPGFEPLTELLLKFEAVFESLAQRGITDLTTVTNAEAGLPKHHLLLWRITGDFCKSHAEILPRKQFYRNGWRRIGRVLRRAGIPLKQTVPTKLLGETNDLLKLDDITGFHFYATFYDIEQLLELPDFAAKMAPVVVFAEKNRRPD